MTNTVEERVSIQGGAGKAPLYASLASLLEQRILEGKYQVSSALPSEKELTELFDVSRQTVRQALRSLRERGLISSHPGIGTIVRRQASNNVFGAINSIEGLLQFAQDSEMHKISLREVRASEQLASLIECQPGVLLSENSFTRHKVGESLPMSFVRIYVHPRFAAAHESPEVFHDPIYKRIERMFGVRICEVRQDITATSLQTEIASLVQAPPGSAALQIVRLYYDDNDEVIQASLSYYPEGRYVQSGRFRASPA
jgi:GntR family transcriptional regulator